MIIPDSSAPSLPSSCPGSPGVQSDSHHNGLTIIITFINMPRSPAISPPRPSIAISIVAMHTVVPRFSFLRVTFLLYSPRNDTIASSRVLLLYSIPYKREEPSRACERWHAPPSGSFFCVCFTGSFTLHGALLSCFVVVSKKGFRPLEFSSDMSSRLSHCVTYSCYSVLDSSNGTSE